MYYPNAFYKFSIIAFSLFRYLTAIYKTKNKKMKSYFYFFI